MLEREVVLGERHRARVEPHVDHLRHAAHRQAAVRLAFGVLVRALELQLVDERAVVVGELLPVRSCSSSKEPITCTWPASQRHTGSGVPQ